MSCIEVIQSKKLYLGNAFTEMVTIIKYEKFVCL